MESNFGKCDIVSCYTYENIEIVKIDGKKYVKRKRDGKIMHANKEVSRDNTKRKIRRQRNSYFES